MIRRSYAGAQPALTGGDDRPTTPCVNNRHVYDALIDHPHSADNRYVIEAARTLCATCPIWRACLTENRREEWAQAVATGKTLMQRTKAS